MTTVKQLREQLEQLPDDMLVLICDSQYGYNGQNNEEIEAKVGEYAFYPDGFNYGRTRYNKLYPDSVHAKYCLIY